MPDKTARSPRARRAKPAASCVGIFYLVRGKLWIDTTPLSHAGTFGEFAIHERDHIVYWGELAGAGSVPHGEYEEHPRGRVAYNMTSERFLFLADRCILRKKNVVEAILRRLNLPRKSTEIKTDSHYRCSECLGLTGKPE